MRKVSSPARRLNKNQPHKFPTSFSAIPREIWLSRCSYYLHYESISILSTAKRWQGVSTPQPSAWSDIGRHRAGDLPRESIIQPKVRGTLLCVGRSGTTDTVLVRERELVKPLSKLMGSFGRQKRNNDSKPTTTIGITHNLAIALRHLRHAKKPRILWIDALCINQDDLPERSAEVLEMGSIYSNARQVIVWLGPS